MVNFCKGKGDGIRADAKIKLTGGRYTYYDADTDKELEQYKRLIENEELAHRVTISTKVLDVGVNIKTENVTLLCLMMTQSRSSNGWEKES